MHPPSKEDEQLSYFELLTLTEMAEVSKDVDRTNMAPPNACSLLQAAKLEPLIEIEDVTRLFANPSIPKNRAPPLPPAVQLLKKEDSDKNVNSGKLATEYHSAPPEPCALEEEMTVLEILMVGAPSMNKLPPSAAALHPVNDDDETDIVTIDL